MAIKTITVCDGCEIELKEKREKYFLKLETDRFWNAVEMDTNEVNLIFCENCAENIKSSLETIARRQI